MLITMSRVISFWNLIPEQEKWNLANMPVTKHFLFFLNWANLHIDSAIENANKRRTSAVMN